MNKTLWGKLLLLSLIGAVLCCSGCARKRPEAEPIRPYYGSAQLDKLRVLIMPAYRDWHRKILNDNAADYIYRRAKLDIPGTNCAPGLSFQDRNQERAFRKLLDELRTDHFLRVNYEPKKITQLNNYTATDLLLVTEVVQYEQNWTRMRTPVSRFQLGTTNRELAKVTRLALAGTVYDVSSGRLLFYATSKAAINDTQHGFSFEVAAEKTVKQLWRDIKKELIKLSKKYPYERPLTETGSIEQINENNNKKANASNSRDASREVPVGVFDFRNP